MNHGRFMDQLKLAFEIVVEMDYFQDLLFQLHTCGVGCPPDCIKKKSAIAITALVLDSVDATVTKLKTPHGLLESDIIRFVTVITKEIWSFYDLNALPLEFDQTSVRNQVIHQAIYLKAKTIIQLMPNFRGWK